MLSKEVMGIQTVEWEGEREGAKEDSGREREDSKESQRARERELSLEQRASMCTKELPLKAPHKCCLDMYPPPHMTHTSSQGTTLLLLRFALIDTNNVGSRSWAFTKGPCVVSITLPFGELPFGEVHLPFGEVHLPFGVVDLPPSPPPPSSSSGLRPDVLEVLSFLLPLYNPLCGCF